MDKSERRSQYLALYRQQLKRDTDAMGYGQAQDHVLSPKHRNHSTLPSSLAIAALVLALLGLASAQL